MKHFAADERGRTRTVHRAFTRNPVGICLFACVFHFFSAPPADASETLMRVIVPVADLRSDRRDALPDTYAHDPLQESQLVYGERVRVHQIDGDWVLIESLDQREFTHKKKWEGYPGWLKAKTLAPIPGSVAGWPVRGVVRKFRAWIYSRPTFRSDRIIRVPFGGLIDVRSNRDAWYEVAAPSGTFGWMRRTDVDVATRPAGAPRPASVSPSNALRTTLWKNVRMFLGVPYYWGGLSAFDANYPSAMTGVDCSGLTHLCYRAAGMNIPRDSHEQWMKSHPLKRSELVRGDLVFLANAEKPDRVVHVVMYVGGEFLIEGPGTGLKVRRATFKRKLGRRLAEIESGDVVGAKVVYFGRPIYDE